MAKNMTITADTYSTYSPGDWVVHDAHGIGQIIAIENKSIGDKEADYYRIDTEDSTLWVPLGGESLLRLLAPPEEFAEATAVLKRPSRQMSTNYRSRLARIRRAQASGTPRALARIVRDLWARQQRQGRLSKTENQALREMSSQLLAEWSVSMNMEENKAREKFYTLLRQHALSVAVPRQI